ncbi:hypothetical protein FQR65_LT04695 [Abscondita terminalis]|nr:hypothetical protein FQR65_LT04695 [Abscondita terminalis]
MSAKQLVKLFIFAILLCNALAAKRDCKHLGGICTLHRCRPSKLFHNTNCVDNAICCLELPFMDGYN